MPWYLCVFAQQDRLKDFVVPELLSVAKYFNIDIKLDEAQLARSRDEEFTPFLKVFVDSEEDLKKIGSRIVQVKGFYDIWGEGQTYEELIEDLKKNVSEEKMNQYTNPDATFCIKMNAYGRKYPIPDQREKFKIFAPFPCFKIKVSIKNPTYKYTVFEDVGLHKPKDLPPKRIYFARKITRGNRRIIDEFTLKKRRYLSTTSMAAELSFQIANLSLSGPGKFVFDPFVGSGSILVSCAKYGARVIGSDIDPRVIRGKEKEKHVISNFHQYGITNQLVDLIISDQAKPVWRTDVGPIFDAIVCDPPYGIRESAKRIGPKAGKEVKPIADELRDTHISPKVLYEVPDILVDLVDFAARMLRLGGRLVFWFPAIIETYHDDHLPQHPCFRHIANSEQKLSSKHARRLITMEKIAEYDAKTHSTAQYVTSPASVQNFRTQVLGPNKPQSQT